MEKIIVLFGKSEASFNALQYALDLADFADANVELILCGEEFAHSYPLIANLDNLYSNTSGIFSDETVRVNLIPKSTFFSNSSKAQNDILVVLVGIEDVADSKTMSLIPTLEINYPIVFLSKDEVFRVPENMLFVSCFENANESLMVKWGMLARMFDSKLKFIFKLPNLDRLAEEEKIYRQLFSDKDPDFSFEMSFHAQDDFEAVVVAEINENNMDCLVINPCELPKFTDDVRYTGVIPFHEQTKKPIVLLGDKSIVVSPKMVKKN